MYVTAYMKKGLFKPFFSDIDTFVSGFELKKCKNGVRYSLFHCFRNVKRNVVVLCINSKITKIYGNLKMVTHIVIDYTINNKLIFNKGGKNCENEKNAFSISDNLHVNDTIGRLWRRTKAS